MKTHNTLTLDDIRAICGEQKGGLYGSVTKQYDSGRAAKVPFMVTFVQPVAESRACELHTQWFDAVGNPQFRSTLFKRKT